MKFSIYIFLVTIVVILGTYVYISDSLNLESSNVHYPSQTNSHFEAMAANPLGCTMTSDMIEEEIKNQDFKKPSYLPTKYSLQDGITHRGILSLYYAPDSMCNPDSNYSSFNDGVIQYYTATTDGKPNEINKGLEYFKEYKANSDRPNVISIFKINGKPAMGWETGMKKDITQYENGTIVEEQDISYPAQIQVIDPNSKNFYMFKGYITMSELQKMAESTVTP